jgi:hypothetical protein
MRRRVPPYGRRVTLVCAPVHVAGLGGGLFGTFFVVPQLMGQAVAVMLVGCAAVPQTRYGSGLFDELVWRASVDGSIA